MVSINRQQTGNRRRVEAWAIVLEELREYLKNAQANVHEVSTQDIKDAQACVTTLHKVWDTAER